MIKDAFLRVAVSTSLAASSVLTAALPASADPVKPNPSPQLPGGLQDKLNTLLGLFMGVVIFACVAGVLIVAALLAVAAKRGTIDDHIGRLGAVMGACILVGGSSTLVMFLV